MAAEIGKFHLFDVDAVDVHGAFLNVVETEQQREECCLASAGVADDGYGFSGLDGEGCIAEDPVGSRFAWSLSARGRRGTSRVALGWTGEGALLHASVAGLPALARNIFIRFAVGEPDMVELDAA